MFTFIRKFQRQIVFLDHEINIRNTWAIVILDLKLIDIYPEFFSFIAGLQRSLQILSFIGEYTTVFEQYNASHIRCFFAKISLEWCKHLHGAFHILSGNDGLSAPF